ncbi:hypothetical protein cand_026520 [Cryptosporidium andersoni]|uniref:Uncharacterized protein n=1 Tax=Cryptosporidium andersoni TaxID=117008 RepID=A0A1J4MA47_9CRYT|nr:hypothetical protein cand_026520 [Cryptosporidium andersoni]
MLQNYCVEDFITSICSLEIVLNQARERELRDCLYYWRYTSKLIKELNIQKKRYNIYMLDGFYALARQTQAVCMLFHIFALHEYKLKNYALTTLKIYSNMYNSKYENKILDSYIDLIHMFSNFSKILDLYKYRIINKSFRYIVGYYDKEIVNSINGVDSVLSTDETNKYSISDITIPKIEEEVVESNMNLENLEDRNLKRSVVKSDLRNSLNNGLNSGLRIPCTFEDVSMNSTDPRVSEYVAYIHGSLVPNSLDKTKTVYKSGDIFLNTKKKVSFKDQIDRRNTTPSMPSYQMDNYKIEGFTSTTYEPLFYHKPIDKFNSARNVHIKYYPPPTLALGKSSILNSSSNTPQISPQSSSSKNINFQIMHNYNNENNSSYMNNLKWKCSSNNYRLLNNKESYVTIKRSPRSSDHAKNVLNPCIGLASESTNIFTSITDHIKSIF